MKIQSEKLINDLIEITQSHLDFVEKLKIKSDSELNFRKSPESWSPLECLEHLNLYGNFYIPEIRRKIDSAHVNPQEVFTSGWLGNYFANSMLPKEKLNKMKTFKKMNPIYEKLDKSVLDEFISQQQKMIELLERSRKVNLVKVKTGISITNLIRFRLGDTFRFVIYHNERHIRQAGSIFK